MANSPPPPGSGLDRTRVAGLALVCLAAAPLLWGLFPDQSALAAAALRVGLVMGALWLALPKSGQPLPWTWAAPLLGIALGLAVLARNVRMLLVLAPILVLLFVLAVLLRPRPKKRTTRPRY